MSLDLGELSGELGLDMSPMERALGMADVALAGFASEGETKAKAAGDGIGKGVAAGVDEVTRLLNELPKNAKGTISETSAEFRALPRMMKVALLEAKADAAYAFRQIPPEAKAAGVDAATALGAGLDGAKAEAEDAGRDAGKGFSDEFKKNAADAAKAAGAAVGVGLGAGVADNLSVDAANRKLIAQLGLNHSEIAAVGKMAGKIYAGNFGDDATIRQAMRLVVQNIDTDINSADFQPLTEKILAVSDAMDQDLGMTTAAVGQMMRTGLAKDATEALDILTRGLQGPANKADDLMETFNEYGTQFRALGLTGADAMGLISQAVQGGARDADVAADAIKEFAAITQGNLEQTTAQGVVMTTELGGAFNTVIGPGRDMYKVQADLAAGGPRARKAFDMMVDGLRKIEDPAARSKTAVTLFGTLSEDMQKALMNMDLSKARKELGDYAGAAQNVANETGGGPQASVDGFGKRMIQMGRDAIDAMGPVAGVAGAVAAFAPAALSVLGPIAQMVGARAMQTAAAATAGGAETAATTATTTGWLRAAAASTAGAIKMAASWLIAIGPIVLVVAAVAGVAYLIYKNWDKIKEYTAKAWNWVVAKVKKVPGLLLAIFRNFTLPGLIIKHWDSIKSGTIRVATSIVDWVSKLPGKFVRGMSSMGRLLREHASAAFGRMKDGATNKAEDLLTWLVGLPERMVKKIGDIGATMKAVGGNVVSGIWEGIKDGGDWLADKLWDWVRDVIPGPVLKALGIASPSKVMRDLAKWIPAGMAAGIDDGSPMVDAAVGRMAGRVKITASTQPITWGDTHATSSASGSGAGCACGGRPIVVQGDTNPEATAAKVVRRLAFAGGA